MTPERLKEIEATFAEFDRGVGYGSPPIDKEAAVALQSCIEELKSQSSPASQSWVEDTALFVSLRMIAHEIKRGQHIEDVEMRCATLNKAADRLQSLTAPPTPVGERLTVRIAVAVDWKGDWNCSGWRGCDDDTAFSNVIDTLEPGENRYIVTADLEVPRVQEVAGRVTQA